MSTAVDEKLDAITRLCEQHGVAELYLFGSAADGGFVPGKSDYDFLVRFVPCPPLEHGNHYLRLLEDLQDLLNARVDLVGIDSISNPYFRESAMESRRLLYAA